jgi:NAD(P)H-dependent flavin oxidoreductase YrpB (nitropropane dioxygenase family)
MALPDALRGKLSVPVIGAPMFLVSFPPLVAAQCKAGGGRGLPPRQRAAHGAV